MSKSVLIKTSKTDSSKNSVCVGEIIINRRTGICTIISLYTIESFRGQGYGKMVLSDIINYCLKKGIKKIYVDDMSDRFNQSNNIYINFGFKYIDVNFPEMILIM